MGGKDEQIDAYRVIRSGMLARSLNQLGGSRRGTGLWVDGLMGLDVRGSSTTIVSTLTSKALERSTSGPLVGL
jgi:hypothetical protein